MSLVPSRDTSLHREGEKLTYLDLVQLPEDRMRHELIAGEHHVSPPPNLRHQAIAGRIYFSLVAHIEQSGGGQIYIAPTGVLLSDQDMVEPDVLYVSNQRKDILTEQWVRGAPDLVVEVGSPSTRRRDNQDKLRLYERFGVLEYWFADPDLDAVTVYRRVDERLVRVAEPTLANQDTLTTPLLPGLQISLSKIFGT
jgi:Uma2 family endonuclease